MSNMLDLFNLKGKKAVVTGAARGLSLGIATGLHDAGVEVVLMDVLDTVHESAAVLGKSGSRAYAVQANLSGRENIETAFKKAVDLLGNVDILVNGAGVQHRCAAVGFPVSEWERVLDINLTTTFHMCQLAGRLMIEKGAGKIINIASMLTFFGGVMIPAYSASKGGVAQLTKALSNEWAGLGVNVNAIAPGYMETDLTATMRDYPDQVEEITRRIPAGRWGTPDDVKGICIFLASEASKYITGSIIAVDGGYQCR
ncbi:MAG: SDR family oxidoreductase [Christensenellaceae bacterium]|jgi:2-deoxy-D-gluconate 3-dehydrogenase